MSDTDDRDEIEELFGMRAARRGAYSEEFADTPPAPEQAPLPKPVVKTPVKLRPPGSIQPHPHDPPAKRPAARPAPVIIEDEEFLGADALPDLSDLSLLPIEQVSAPPARPKAPAAAATSARTAPAKPEPSPERSPGSTQRPASAVPVNSMASPAKPTPSARPAATAQSAPAPAPAPTPSAAPATPPTATSQAAPAAQPAAKAQAAPAPRPQPAPQQTPKAEPPKAEAAPQAKPQPGPPPSSEAKAAPAPATTPAPTAPEAASATAPAPRSTPAAEGGPRTRPRASEFSYESDHSPGLKDDGTSLLATRGLVKIYDGRTVVNGVDIHVRPGEIVGLLGPNGAGKTTSFYMIVGLVPPNGGEVRFQGTDVTHMPMYQRARLGMGYLPQEESIFRKLTVEENLMAVLETLNLSRQERLARCQELLERFSITHIRKNVALTCSGGEKRRLTIARSLVTMPSLLMLDEPFSGVDPIAVNEIQGIVEDLRKSGLAILITDHNARQTLELVDRAYLIYEGRVLREGSRDFLINDPVSRELYLGDRFTM